MSATVTVEVTAQDIAAGKRNDCLACPIALALQRATGTKRTSARLNLFYAIGGEGINGECKPPLEARQFMDDFDSGKPVEPFTFTVELS